MSESDLPLDEWVNLSHSSGSDHSQAYLVAVDVGHDQLQAWLDEGLISEMTLSGDDVPLDALQTGDGLLILERHEWRPRATAYAQTEDSDDDE